MAKETNSSGEPAPREAAATKNKQGTARKVASPKPPKAVAAAANAACSFGSSASAPGAEPSPAELYQEISIRAYQFYCERGGHHGSHEADWHRAEQEVRAKYKSGA